MFILKSASNRRVSNNNEEISNNNNNNNQGGDYYYGINDDGKNKGKYDGEVKNNNKEGGGGSCTILTVWRKSLLVSCSGFTVIDCKGELLFRVDNYCGSRPPEIVLMDSSGKSLLTVRRHKTLRLVDDWVVYDGETSDLSNKKSLKKQPIAYVKKNVSLLQGQSSVLAHVFMSRSSKRPTYVIEGSYAQRYCKVFDKSSKAIVAEIKRKEAVNGCASFGLDVFHLVVAPGFDTGFAMALVLLLDQMYS